MICLWKNKGNFKITKNKRNTINPDLSCVLITKKCDENKYYKFNYDPNFWMNNRSKHEITEIQKLIDENSHHFDLKKRYNCCNCISYILNIEHDYVDLLKYISSLVRSSKNLSKCLPDWMIRIYMDNSVYNHIKSVKTYYSINKDEDIKELLYENWQYLFNAENVEIYTFVCDDSSYSNRRKRSLRFNILYDYDVNVSIIRDADGILTIQDCHNIDVFSKSNKMMYLAPFGEYIKSTNLILNTNKAEISSYSEWLAIYKDHLRKLTFQNIGIYMIFLLEHLV